MTKIVSVCIVTCAHHHTHASACSGHKHRAHTHIYRGGGGWMDGWMDVCVWMCVVEVRRMED
jgi:hypothetical protein